MNDDSALGVARLNNREGWSGCQPSGLVEQTGRPDVVIGLKTGQQLVRNCQVTIFFSIYASNRNK